MNAPEPVKARQCRINGNGDRVVVDSVDGERVWTRTLHVDSDGEVSAHQPEERTVTEVSRWPLAVAP